MADTEDRHWVAGRSGNTSNAVHTILCVLSQGPPHPGGSVELTVSRMTATGNLLIKGSEAEECFVRRQANRMEGPRVAPELARRSEPSQRHLGSCVWALLAACTSWSASIHTSRRWGRRLCLLLPCGRCKPRGNPAGYKWAGKWLQICLC